jgi:hypothetical protein
LLLPLPPTRTRQFFIIAASSVFYKRAMNKRLGHETGETLFEKRGHRWALTSLGFDVWGETEKREEA